LFGRFELREIKMKKVKIVTDMVVDEEVELEDEEE